MTKEHTLEEIKYRLSDLGVQIGNIAINYITELEKETRCECTRCVYSDSPCIRSDYGVENDEDVCPNYENVFVAYTQLKEEIAELKEQNTNLQEMLKTERSVTCKEEFLKKVTELEQENAELKEKNKWYSEQICNKECAEVWGNLTKARDLIEDMYDKIPASHSDYYKDVMERARAFLSEVEK